MGERSGTWPCGAATIAGSTSSLPTLYQRLISGESGEALDAEADAFLREQLRLAQLPDIDLPQPTDELEHWPTRRSEAAGREFQQYLSERRTGAPRRYFRHRAHALGFIRASAPTKLVDGAWLSGLAKQWQDIRVRDLIATWLDELGEGFASHNHVAVYTRLLAEQDCEDWHDLPASYFLPGTVQLALGRLADDYLPEVIGYNLGYEQPPLHMLITAHELAELDINPWYFALHVTVDNAVSGHALMATRAARRAVPIMGDANVFWHRVRAGFALSEQRPGALELINDFDLDAEVIRILRSKARVGRCMHNNCMRIEGKHINEWLRLPEQVPALLRAMQRNGWIRRGHDPEHSRFWRALVGENAPMFGVFTRYEQQVLADWIRDQPNGPAVNGVPKLGRTHRAGDEYSACCSATCSNNAAMNYSSDPGGNLDPSSEEYRLLAMLERAENAEAAVAVLLPLLQPQTHPTPAGLLATRIYRRIFGGQPLHHAVHRERLSFR